jgi:hypothetical protein
MLLSILAVAILAFVALLFYAARSADPNNVWGKPLNTITSDDWAWLQSELSQEELDFFTQEVRKMTRDEYATSSVKFVMKAFYETKLREVPKDGF